MPTTNNIVGVAVSAALIVCFSASGAAAQSFDSNIVTVEQLLKIDNANALSKVESFKVAGQSRTGASKQAAKPTPAVIKLVKVTGKGDSPRFHFTYNGRPIDNVSVGGNLVDKCQVVGFAAQCVNLSLSPIAKEKPALFTTRQRLVCPQTVCWSGLPVESTVQTAVNGIPSNAIIPSVPMPAGMPPGQQR